MMRACLFGGFEVSGTSALLLEPSRYIKNKTLRRLEVYPHDKRDRESRFLSKLLYWYPNWKFSLELRHRKVEFLRLRAGPAQTLRYTPASNPYSVYSLNGTQEASEGNIFHHGSGRNNHHLAIHKSTNTHSA